MGTQRHQQKHQQILLPDVLLIDPAGVLYDDSVWRRWLFQLVTRMGLYTSPRLFSVTWQTEFLPAVRRRQQTYWESMQRFLLATGMTAAQIDEVCAAGQARKPELEEPICLLHDVRRALVDLRCLPIEISVLATTADAPREMRDRLSRLGIGHAFEEVATLGDLADSSRSKSGGRQHDDGCDCYQTALARRDGADVLFVSADPLKLSHARRAGLRTLACGVESTTRGANTLDGIEQLARAFAGPPYGRRLSA
jgi:hypothetical protein